MKPSFEVKMTQEALFEFLMFHTYHGIKGILYLIVGVGCWLGAIASFAMGKVSLGLGLVLVFATCLFIIPMILKFSAGRSKKVKYTVCRSIIHWKRTDFAWSVTEKTRSLHGRICTG